MWPMLVQASRRMPGRKILHGVEWVMLELGPYFGRRLEEMDLEVAFTPHWTFVYAIGRFVKLLTGLGSNQYHYVKGMRCMVCSGAFGP